MKIRPTSPQDIPALQVIVDANQLFPSELLPEMVSSYLTGETQSEVWLTCESNGRVIGFCYAVPEQMTDGTWNMLAIAIDPQAQGGGAGGVLLAYLETGLHAQGCRVLIVDTSGAAEFTRTRAFYHKNGYAEEARIRDFWAAGEDKIVFWKSLA